MATVKEAIAGILHADAQSLAAGALGTLCGYDATTKPRIVFYQYPKERVATPIITYRIAAESERFPRSIFLDVVVWGGDLKAIHDRVHELLNERREIESTDWQVKGLLYESSGPELWDDDLKCYFQRARYRAVVVKLT